MIREIWYETSRVVLRIVLLLFYRKITITGLDKLPKKTPVIFAPNHQNAFMDALVVVGFTHHRIWFLTRADIFKKKVAIFLLDSLRLTPVYRQRDGIKALEKNEEVFAKCYRNFDKGECILVFPEGNHRAMRTLRPISKGITRIAFGYEDASEEIKDLAIVPVGITYSEATMYNGSIKVNHCEPIYLKDYMDQYKEQPQVAMRQLTSKLKEELSDAMLDINEKHYKVIDTLLRLDDSIFNKHDVQELQKIADQIHEYLEQNPEEVLKLNDAVTEIPILKKPRPSIFQLILSFLFIPAYIGSWIMAPYYFLVKKVLKGANDEAFKSSLKAASAMYLGLPYVLVLTILALVFGPGLYIKLTLAAFALSSFFIFVYYTNLWEKLKNWKHYPTRSMLLDVRKSIVGE